MRLTKRSIDALAPRDREYLAVDSSVAGFGVRVRPSGLKTFVFEYRPKGATAKRKLTLGTFGALTVDQARELAKMHAGTVAAGGNPAEARKTARAAAKAERTLNELLDAFLIDRAATKKARTIAEYRRLLERDVRPKLGVKRLGRIDRVDVRALHRAMQDRPYMANNTLKTLRAAFAFAIDDGILATNPATGIALYPEAERERFLTDDEFARLGDALRRAETIGVPVPEASKRKKGGMSKARRTKRTGRTRGKYAVREKPPTLHVANPDVIAAIRLLLLTGWREQEVLSLEWSMVDFQRGFVTLPESKTGRSRRPLGAQALSLLDERERRGKYVFPSPVVRKDGVERPIVEIARTWYAVREAAELPDLRLHDVRHSFASVSVGDLGLSLHLTAPLLGHVRTATTERYAHLANDPVKRAADAVSGRVVELLDAKTNTPPAPDPNVATSVIPFPQRA